MPKAKLKLDPETNEDESLDASKLPDEDAALVVQDKAAIAAGFGKKVTLNVLDTKDMELVYFKLIEPLSVEEIAELAGIDYLNEMDKLKKVAMLEKLNFIADQIYRLSQSMYHDQECNQRVMTSEHPHKKWLSSYFRDRMAASKKEVVDQVMNSVQLPLRCFYPIKESEYNKLMKPVIAQREANAKVALANARALQHTHSKGVQQAARELYNSNQSAQKVGVNFLANKVPKGSENLAPSDPDRVTSVFADEETRKFVACVRLESTLSANQE